MPGVGFFLSLVYVGGPPGGGGGGGGYSDLVPTGVCR